MMKQFLSATWRQFKRCMHWKFGIIRKYPVLCAYLAFLEGVIIGLLIYHYFFQVRFSCCVELG
jgi:hypothetical protein